MIGYTLMLLITLVVVIVGLIVVGAAMWSWRKDKRRQEAIQESSSPLP